MIYDDTEEKLDALMLAIRAHKVARNVEDEKQRLVEAAEAELWAARDATLKAATAWSIARVALLKSWGMD